MKFTNPEHQRIYEEIKGKREKQAASTEQRPSTGRSAGTVFVEEARIVAVDDTEL